MNITTIHYGKILKSWKCRKILQFSVKLAKNWDMSGKEICQGKSHIVNFIFGSKTVCSNVIAQKLYGAYRAGSIFVVDCMGGDYRGMGGSIPQKILLGGRKGKRPPTTATSSKKIDFFHFSCHQTLFSSLQNAYSSEELNGLVYYQNSIFFQRQGGFATLAP